MSLKNIFPFRGFQKSINYLLQKIFSIPFKGWFCEEDKLWISKWFIIVFFSSIVTATIASRAAEKPSNISQDNWKELENIASWEDIAYLLKYGDRDCKDYLITTSVTEGSKTRTTTDDSRMRDCEKVMRILRIEPKKEGDKSGCEGAKETFDEAKKEADEKCSQIRSSNITRCMAIMRSCEDCPDEKGKKCARLPSGAKCSQLAGEDLEELKEEIKDGKETKKDLEEELRDLRDDVLDKQGELAEAKQRYEEDLNTLQTDLQEAQDEMETTVREKQADIDENLQKAISSVQGELAKSLKIQNAFVNEIANAERTRREAAQKIYEKCRHTANARLAAYRQYRRRAIREGRYGNKGVRKLMGKMRVSFTKQDNLRYQSYYSGCLAESAPLLAAVEEDYQTALTVIEQKKQEMLAQYSALQAQLQQLNNQAYQKKSQIIQDFAKSTDKALSRFNANRVQRIKQYKSESQQLNMALMSLNRDVQKKEGQLESVASRQGFNSYLAQSLKRKGVSSKEDKAEVNVAEAQAALANFRDSVMQTYDECCARLVSFSKAEEEAEKEGKKELDTEQINKVWEEAQNTRDCKSFQFDFNRIYSDIKFEDYRHGENRRRMEREIEYGSQ